MATAEEILAAAFASEAIVVDLANRTLTIPSTLTHIGVESDDDVFKVPFMLPRYYGDIDFAEFDININYLNAHGQGDVYDVTDAAIGEDTIEFSWLVGRYAAAYAGVVTFSVCLKKYNSEDASIVDQEFNTEPAILTVKKGLETDEAVVEAHADVIAKLCDYINNMNVRITRLEEFVGFGENYGNSKIEFIDGVLIISPGGPSMEDDTNQDGSGSTTPSDPVNPPSGSEDEEEVAYALFGKFVMDETVELPSETMSFVNVNMKTGENYGISMTKITVSNNGIEYVISGSKKKVAGSDGIWLEDGYRYIDFGDGVTVDEAFYNWFNAYSGVYEEPDLPDTYSLFISGGYGVSVYTNGNDSKAMSVTGDLIECRGLYKFKFTSDNVDFYFRSGYYNEPGQIISIEPDADGWYAITQVTTVVVTAGGENSRRVYNYLTNCTTNNTAKSVMLDAPYTAQISPNDGCYIDSVTITMNGINVTNDVYANGTIDIPAVTGDISISISAVAFVGNKYKIDVLSPGASFVYINLDDATPISIAQGQTEIHGVAKIKFAGANISSCSFTAGSQSWADGNPLVLTPNEDGWYTLYQDCSVAVTIRSNVTPDANILYGRWTFNEEVALPEKLVTVKGAEIYTGDGYGTEITMITAQAGVGLIYSNEDTQTQAYAISADGEWNEVSYRSVDFGNLGEVVDDEFYSWFTANAVAGGLEYVSVTKDLTNMVITNSDSSAAVGYPYTAMVTADVTVVYPEDVSVELMVKVVMDGVDVTSEVYSMGVISIPKVTGAITITAIAAIRYYLKDWWTLNKVVDVTSGITISNDGKFNALTGYDYTEHVVGINLWSTDMIYWMGPDGTRKVVGSVDGTEGTFSSSKYQFLYFGTDGYEVDAYTYNWFLENAVKGEPGG